ncbi:DNA-primase RepB domain-containing protein [Microvirga sp. BSC39]|uniref:DNA-primase RepB domain-containing protein n=1 Tax=Microvirga sp. BSC39 TaxID=1549810 RepID=UPI0004E8C3FF|nr:DNA-primase RepB domain-containing protein [Microvirga sp. BSC39]KFG66740.1 hypothetical protein JH26_25670 [Microvirga sp. BSC39]
MLPLVVIHPALADRDQNKQGRQAFAIGDVENMTEAAVMYAQEGYNVYVEARTIAKNTPPGRRGDLSYTRGVFAFVVDSDADKGKAGHIDFEPSLVVETSPGNFQPWLFLDQALTAEQARPLGAAIRAATGADSATGVVTQPYRVAGTLNYPTKTKQQRGRFAVEPVKLASQGSRVWTHDELTTRFPAVVERKLSDAALPVGRSGKGSEKVVQLLTRLVPQGKRSEQFFEAVAVAVEEGLTPDDFEALCLQHRQGCVSRFATPETLRKDIERVWVKKLGKDAAEKVPQRDKGRIKRLPAVVTVEQIELLHARQLIKEAVQSFFKNSGRELMPIVWTQGWSVPSARQLTLVQAIAVATGVGKTRTTTYEIVDYVRQLRNQGDQRKIALLVPLHKLGDQIVKDFAALGVQAQVYRGREADDPNRPGKKMCDDLPAVKAANSVGTSVEASCCEDRRPDGTMVRCPFFDQCGFQRQKQSDPDVWIGSHEYLFRKPKAFGQVAKLIIDEGFSQSGLLTLPKDRKGKGLTVEELEAPVEFMPQLTATRGKMAQALRMQPEPERLRSDRLAPVEQRWLVAAGLTVEECREAAVKHEWSLVEQPQLYPGMPAEERQAEIARVKRPPTFVRRMARMWRAAQHLLEQSDTEAASGRLFVEFQGTEQGRIRVAQTQGLREIDAAWHEIDTLLLDATLPPLRVLNAFFPQGVVQVANLRNVALPREHVRIEQVLGAPVAKTKLFDRMRENAPILRNLQALRRYILQEWLAVGRKSALVIAQKEVASWLKANLPKEIAVEHFNNLTGINDYGGVRLLITLGRVLPGPEEVELMAGALTGVMPMPASVKKNNWTWYDPTEKLVTTRDGAAYSFEVDLKHPDPTAEDMRTLTCDAELVQAIGRARAVNRDASKPLDIRILADVQLDGFPVDELKVWKQPNDEESQEVDEMKASDEVVAAVIPAGREVEMIVDGMILQSATDMAKAWPEVWASRDAVNAWRSRAMISVSRPFREIIKGNDTEIPAAWGIVEYRPTGRGQQTRKAYFNPAVVPDPRAWLETRLCEGDELAFCDVIRAPRAPVAGAPAASVGVDEAGRVVVGRKAPIGEQTPPVAEVPEIEAPALSALQLRARQALQARMSGQQSTRH